jgi:hypothetical protein
MTTPYLSVVIVGRNDTYGVNFLDRLNTFVRSLDHQVKDYSDLLELIVVEWNPLADRAPLKDVIFQPNNLELRVITVSSEIHNSINHPTPVLEFYGKNVGIRRARGEFVLTTNPDIIFTDQLIEEFSQRRLQPEYVYRTDRYDFVSDGIDQVDPSNYVEFALSKTFQAHITHDHGYSSPEFQAPDSLEQLPHTPALNSALHANGCGDFILAARSAFFLARGMYEGTVHRYHNDSFSLLRLAFANLKQALFTTPLCIFHQHHERRPVEEAWDPAKATAIGSSAGNVNWGLNSVDLVEWSNH